MFILGGSGAPVGEGRTWATAGENLEATALSKKQMSEKLMMSRLLQDAGFLTSVVQLAGIVQLLAWPVRSGHHGAGGRNSATKIFSLWNPCSLRRQRGTSSVVGNR